MPLRTLTAACLLVSTFGHAYAADPADAEKPPVAKEGAPTSFFLFADTQVSYRYQAQSVTPGIQILQADGRFVSREGPSNILNISHANAWAYGTNFFSLDVYKYGSQFPAGTTKPPGSIAAPYYEPYGSTDAYGLYRGTLSLNALTNTKYFTVPGIIKDMSLAFGFDADTQNDAFGSEKRSVVGGLNLSFDVPAGFLNLSMHAYKEWNRNGFSIGPDRDRSFDLVPQFEVVYNFPLTFTGLPLSLAGFNTIVLPKGRGTQNAAIFAFNPPRGLDFLSRTNLVLDLGKLVYDQPGRVDVFIGFEYWLNKFGNVETATFKGTEQKSFLAGVAFHI